MNRNIKNYRKIKAIIKKWEKDQIKNAKIKAANPYYPEMDERKAAARIDWVKAKAARLLEEVEAANKAPRLDEIELSFVWRKGVHGQQARAEGSISWGGQGPFFARSKWTTGIGDDKKSMAAGDMLAFDERRGDDKTEKGLKATARAVLARLLIENWDRVSLCYPFDFSGGEYFPGFSFGSICGRGMLSLYRLFRDQGAETVIPGFLLRIGTGKYFIAVRASK